MFCRWAAGSRQKHSLPNLAYEYNALEPVISREIMNLHHSKHHATYVNNLNIAEEKLALAQSKGPALLTLHSIFKPCYCFDVGIRIKKMCNVNSRVKLSSRTTRPNKFQVTRSNFFLNLNFSSPCIFDSMLLI